MRGFGCGGTVVFASSIKGSTKYSERAILELVPHMIAGIATRRQSYAKAKTESTKDARDTRCGDGWADMEVMSGSPAA